MDQAAGAELGELGCVGDVRLAAGQVLDLPSADEDHVQALGRHVAEGLPVVTGRLDHQGDLGGEEVVPQTEDRVRGRSPRRGLVRKRPPPLRAGSTDACLGVLLADAEADTASCNTSTVLLPPSPNGTGMPFREGQGGESGILTHVLHSDTPRFPWTAPSTTLTCELTGITETSVQPERTPPCSRQGR